MPRSDRISRYFSLVVVWSAVLVALFPLYWLFVTSLKNPLEIFSDVPTLIPEQPTLRNYRVVIDGYDPNRGLRVPIIPVFRNSVVIALVTTLIGVSTATAAAYALVRSGLLWFRWLFLAILLMRTIPRITIAIPLFFLLQVLGLLDSIPGLVLAHLTVVTPLATFLMLSFMQDMPVEIEEAALIDGASQAQTLAWIVLPLMAPGIAVTAIFAFILSYNEFLYSLILISSPSARTLPVALSLYIQQYGIAWELLSAVGALATLPVIAFAFLVQRYIVRGLSLGAVKG